MSDLPEGWSLVSLGELGQWGSGGTPPRTNASYYSGGTIPWLVIGDLTDGYVYKVQTFITENGLNNSSAKLLPKDTLLVAMYGSIGKLGITSIECATNQAIAFCRNDASVVTLRYLFYALANAKPALIALGQGGAQQNISQSVLKNFQIPLAPRAEQLRIADQLDTLLARINTCHQHLNTTPALLKRFRQAVLAAATSGRLTEDYRKSSAATVASGMPADWTESNIQTIATDLRYGTSKKCDYSKSGVGVLRIPNIADHGRIDVRDLKSAQFEEKEIEKLALDVGDLLVIRSNGSVELVGKTSIVTEKEAGLLFAGYLMRLRVNSELALPAFVRLCLAAPLQRKYIELTAKSTSGVNNLNAEELRSLTLWLPKPDEQAEIVRRVEKLFKLADRIEARYTAAFAQAQRLNPLVLSKAFRGELIPQDPSDEPASDLLARIAAQRKSATPAPKTRQPRAPRAAHASKESASMTKSRQDEDVKGKPYLADHLRRLGEPVAVQALYQVAELPVADFYKQLAWEVEQGHVRDNTTSLELGHAAG